VGSHAPALPGASAMTDIPSAGEGILGAIVPVILLLTLGILAAIGSRSLRLSPIVGYLTLGVALGGSPLGGIFNTGAVQSLAELGVVFLLFDVGLHFSLRHVRQQAGDIFGFGPVQVAFGALGLGALAILFGLPPGPALLVGATLALSSTAVVARLIAERHQQSCPVGLTGTAILVFQDLAAIVILIVATTLGDGGAVLPAIGVAVVKAVGAFVVAIALARVAVRPLFDLVARTRNEEVFTAMALLVALATAWATGYIGLSLTLGAFLGGMVLAETPYRAIVQSEIKPFRGLLLGFFFISVGMSLDRHTLLQAWPAVVLAAVLLVGAKMVLNLLASLVFRWSIPGSTQLGFLLAQGSEFAFVIFSLRSVREMVGEQATAVLVAAVALSLAATPGIAELGRTLAGRMRRRSARESLHPELVPQEMPGPVFVVGMGRRGRAVADALSEFGIGYAAIERDHKRLRDAVADGYTVAFGDVGDPRLWSAVSMEGRRLSVLTAPSLEVSAQLTPMARTFFPNLKRLAAVPDAETGAGFAAAGLLPVIDSDPVPGVALAAAVLAELGIGADKIETWAARQRERTTGQSREALAVAA
jgi:Kef-type K+ transport system membrane component KefB